MRRWLAATILAALWLTVAFTSPARADDAKPSKVMFFGYQMLNGQTFVSLHVSVLSPTDQPHLVKTGDKVDFGPLGVFTIGVFQQGGNANGMNATVELIDAAGHKTVLLFRRATVVKPPAATSTLVLPVDIRTTATT